MSGPIPHPPQPPIELPKGLEHGSFSAYQRYGCRCLPCQEHRRAYARAAARIREKRRVPDDAVHGKVSTYTYYNCRCEDCKEARRSYDRDLWERKDRTREYREKRAQK